VPVVSQRPLQKELQSKKKAFKARRTRGAASSGMQESAARGQKATVKVRVRVRNFMKRKEKLDCSEKAWRVENR